MKIVSTVYFEGRILVFMNTCDVYEFNPRSLMWTLLSRFTEEKLT